MYILLDVEHERHLGGQPHEAEVHQPPPVVGFEGQAVSRGEKRARCAGTRDALVADKSTAYQSRQLILLLGARVRNQTHQ